MLDTIKTIIEYAVRLSGPARDHIRAKQMGHSANDVKMLEFFYRCFDRLAFKMSFHYEVVPDLIRTLDDTAVAISVGVRKTRDEKEIERGRGKAEFDDPSLRAKFDAVVLILWELRYQFDLAVATNTLTIYDNGVFSATAPEFVRLFDERRNDILDIVNPLFISIRKPPFPKIESDSHWVESGESVSKLPPRVHSFYEQRLNRPAPMFPVESQDLVFYEKLEISRKNKPDYFEKINQVQKRLLEMAFDETVEEIAREILKGTFGLEEGEKLLAEKLGLDGTRQEESAGLVKIARKTLLEHPAIKELIELRNKYNDLFPAYNKGLNTD